MYSIKIFQNNNNNYKIFIKNHKEIENYKDYNDYNIETGSIIKPIIDILNIPININFFDLIIEEINKDKDFHNIVKSYGVKKFVISFLDDEFNVKCDKPQQTNFLLKLLFEITDSTINRSKTYLDKIKSQEIIIKKLKMENNYLKNNIDVYKSKISNFELESKKLIDQNSDNDSDGDYSDENNDTKVWSRGFKLF